VQQSAPIAGWQLLAACCFKFAGMACIGDGQVQIRLHQMRLCASHGGLLAKVCAQFLAEPVWQVGQSGRQVLEQRLPVFSHAAQDGIHQRLEPRR
jgi:hypothetical protein